MEDQLVRSSRPINEAWVGGVCAGLANHLGWSALLLRVGFVALASYRLFGAVLYLVLWLVMPKRAFEAGAPGLDAARRSGMRQPASANKRLLDAGLALALTLLGIGLLWLVERNGWGLGPQLIPGGLAVLGLGAIWWETDHIPANDKTASGLWRWVKVFWRNWTRILIVLLGLCFLGAAVAWVVSDLSDVDDLTRMLVLVGLSVAGLGLAVLPVFLRARQEVAQARDDKLVADARADMAAHLHDSVLQTLALIQRQADDPARVQALARRQERELRAYLYDEAVAEAGLSQRLREVTAEVEETFNVQVDFVAVGELDSCPQEAQEAVLGAAREALVNAAKHSGAAKIEAYAEVEDDMLSVFVRDRGQGFDLAAIGADRRGVRSSITERMERTGGRAIIRTSPGEGTEVRLEMPI
jgi:signal transduction histidine kinase